MKVYKKIVAALLASLMFGQTTNGLNLNFIKMENKNINTVKSSGKNLVKKVLIGGAVCIGIPTAVIVPIAIAKICKSRVNTPQIEDMSYLVAHISDRQLARKILEEAKKLQRRSGGIFEIDRSFFEIDPNALLRILTQINAVFDKLPGFEKLLIEDSEKLRSRFMGGYKFSFHAKEVDEKEAGSFVTIISQVVNNHSDATTTDPEEFNLRITISKNDFKDMKIAETKIKESIGNGFLVKVPEGKELESIIVHELGHALQYALYSKTRQMLPANDSEDDDTAKFAEGNKTEILQIAKDKYDTSNSHISNYGKTNAEEWFAELFAHAFLSDAPNNLGLAMQDFLKTHGVY